MKVNDLIKENYDTLDKNDIKLYSYIMQEKTDFIEKNLKEFSKKSKFNESSIVNFAKKIGLDGYSELKYLIKWEREKIVDFDENEIDYTYNDISLSMNMIKGLNLDGLFESLYNTNKIYLIYTGYIQKNLAEELKRNFLNIGIIAYTLDIKNDLELLNKNIKRDDILIAISFSGENTILLDFIKKIRKKIILVSITKLSNNKLSQISDYNLSFVSHEVYRYEENTSIRPVCQYYVIVDFLVLKYLNYKSKYKKKQENA
ncbi:MurR/RpiR family transcriptional regulator [Anaerococcus hydrogenalis]|uniref:RpiR family transcriptional regulator n=1 Tax=Anaerococcus hydrogenalis TaxID=33029 RepID=A0A2N6UGZ4_9FIRM|nr:MurR/RpiR family transcriptional regulator [Anaerococcus hydrogenalis]MDU4018801.1 MurR/RpiR family transcriptional regulator [Finegoldia magna]MDK7695575.1 MurR/RpiR family transcriptional regulator [Anaerococcus hydrogenalis]MDK7697334.1 MurR/RpiR family transcriptional regulator [Anaerococcus hydrogenalis]MDK7708686.1 MurR/RpiR family transcriptional regulator [Anaerococcus hydrogenalis]PMC80878.1 RpiR family transcriptional regulator [Anaerococcus hydrogenalis]